MTRSNFTYLEKEFPILFNIGQTAEFNLYQDPITCLFKLRLFGEKLTELIFEEHKIEFPAENSFHNRLKTLEFEGILPSAVKDLLHSIKNIGNIAVHQNKGTYEEGRSALFSAFKVSKWFYQSYSEENQDLSQIKFRPPEKIDTRLALHELELQYKVLEQRFESVIRERDIKGLSSDRQQEILQRSEQAANKVDMNEAETRVLIDVQLRQAGWEVDTNILNYKLNNTLPQILV